MPLPVLTDSDGLVEVRSKMGDAARHLRDLRSTPEDKRGASFAEDLRAAADFIINGDVIEKGLAAEQRRPEPQPEPNGSRGHGAELNGERRSGGSLAVENEQFEAWASSDHRNGPFVIEVRNLQGGFTAGAYDTDADAWLPVGSPVMVPGSQQRRRAFVRDLMSVQDTGLKTIPYMREKNQVTNETGAQMTSEGSAKAEVVMEWERYNAIVEKITAWIPATDEILTDAPTLRGYIDTRLAYMLMIREEQQVLAGTGTSPQIQGLATLSGTQTQAMATGGGESPGGDYTATIGKAIGKIENVDGEADGVVSNPLDYWAAVTARHANQFDNGFGSGSPGSPNGNITWGLTPVRTRALTGGTTWVGGWGLGSTLFDRQQTTIKVGDQHNDNFIKNLLVILAEKRIAVAWHRPALFVSCTVPVGS